MLFKSATLIGYGLETNGMNITDFLRLDHKPLFLKIDPWYGKKWPK